MSRIAEFRAAKVDADSVKAVHDGVEAKEITATVAAGAFSAGSETVNLHVKFAKPNALVASPVLARCMAAAVQRNMGALLADAAEEARGFLVEAQIKARAEAQEVLREVGP